MRLSSLASSKWADTGGEKSKFGLSAAQLLSVVERFRAAGLDQGIRLLHFHMGSQIANLADYQHGFKEAIRYYGELRNLGLPVDHILSLIHISEPTRRYAISYAVFCLKKK